METLPIIGRLSILGEIPDSEMSWWPVLLTGAVILVILAAGLAVWRPHIVARLILWLPVHLLYRIRVYGRENIPEQGPVLFVSNHVSYIDSVLIFLSQKRPIHFVVWAHYIRAFGIRHIMRLARVIPVDGSAGPRVLVQSLRIASETLARGETVCIFAEGGITRNGQMRPFQRGLEQILKRSPVPVVPICLGGVWGSIFSYYGGRFFWKWPKRVTYPIHVAFGKPLPSTVSAVEVRQAIQKLQADIAVTQRDQRLPVHRDFVKRASRHPFRPCLIDTLNQGKVYRYGETLVGGRILSRLLRPVLGADPMVGVWMPPSVGGVFANIALAFLGKVVVNLNYTLSPQVTHAAVRQCKIRKILTSRMFTAKIPLNIPEVDLIYLEDFRKQVSSLQRIRTYMAVLLLPTFILERWLLQLGRHKPQDLATVIFS
ncbi:MAG TPA: 1-acyl-sn-glycerol-3-phosphate acyltransferase, partial [Gemmataceae bacterium]|nr:1-acyl-sn-glycerol-3-phosphate acyltransferase [Gemmataceae bacterium]